MIADLLQRQRHHFVLWRPGLVNPPPAVVVGEYLPGNPGTFRELGRANLVRDSRHECLWTLGADAFGLRNGGVYHYWFEINDTDPDRVIGTRLLVTDPFARTVDWRLLAPRLPAPYTEADRDPAGVIGYQDGRLVAIDADGTPLTPVTVVPIANLPPNNQLVLYELPSAWSQRGRDGLPLRDANGAPLVGRGFEPVEVGVGTFRDCQELVSRKADAVPAVSMDGHAYLEALGISGIQFLPLADSWNKREWGYATSNPFAADFDLGFPAGHRDPTAGNDLARLVEVCHAQGIRVFSDMVMAFATRGSYQNINFPEFHVRTGVGDPEEVGEHGYRVGFGGRLWRFGRVVEGYHPLTGQRQSLVPARAYQETVLAYWMQHYGLDGIRIDSIANIANREFVGDYVRSARDHFRVRYQKDKVAGQGTPTQPKPEIDARFLAVGEELSFSLSLLTEQRVDGLWNEPFKQRLRAALLGQSYGDDGSVEETVRRCIDSRRVGVADGTQIVNYVTSHDVEGFRNERLANFLAHNGFDQAAILARAKLAFACLLTAVGIPMIFAGEEFADEHDLPNVHPAKQTDPVNFDRLADPWRRELFGYVAKLVHFRRTSPALAVNDTEFLATRSPGGSRVLAWRRGRLGVELSVVVVANWSDVAVDTPVANGLVASFVERWPSLPPQRQWIDVLTGTPVAQETLGRQPLGAWEVRVFAGQ